MIGGKTIQDECTDYVRRKGVLLPGQIYMSTNGNLKCSKIIHVVGPVWRDGGHGEENILYDCVYDTLFEVVQHEMSSVAIPAIGAGIFGVPVQISTDNIVSAVKEFVETENQSRNLKKVYLMDISEDTVESFRKSLNTTFGKSLNQPTVNPSALSPSHRDIASEDCK